MNKIYGVPFSPFVKKVIATCKIKGIEYEVEPSTPFESSDEFKKISHLGKIPAWKDNDVALYDSSVICDYLENKYPQNSVYPSNIIERALTLQFEEYADTKMIELLGKELVYERIVKPMFLKQPTDENIVNENINNKLPKELKYLEDNIKGNYLVGDEITIADIALATQFLNATYAQYHIDKENYPKLSNMLNNVWNTKAFKEIIADDIKAKEKMSETA